MDPIGIPYQVKPCDHVYCYTCLWDLLQQQQIRGQQQQSGNTIDNAVIGHCRVCDEIITSCLPVTDSPQESSSAASMQTTTSLTL